MPANNPVADMYSAYAGQAQNPVGAPAAAASAPAAAALPPNVAAMISGIKKLPGGGWQVPGVGSALDDKALSDLLERQRKASGLDAGALDAALKQAGFRTGSVNGQIVITGQGAAEPQSAPPQYQYGNDAKTPPSVFSPAPGYNGAASAAGGGGSGGSSNRTISSGAFGGGGGGSPNNGVGQMSPFPGTGSTQMSWNDPIGFRNPGSGPGPIGGQGYTGGGFSYGKPRSIFDGMPNNPTFGDVVGQVMRRQEDNRDAALGIVSNARGEINNDPNRQLMQGRTADLLNNPYSMDEATISRILGQTNQGITQRAAELQGNAADRAAAMGNMRGGSLEASRQAIGNDAARQMSEGERNTRIQAAIQNQQDLRSALGAALPGISEQTNAKNALDTTAARDILGGSSYSGDAFLSQMMMGKQGNPYNVAVPGQGYNLGSNTQARY